MNILEMFPSRFLAAADFGGESRVLTIRSVEVEKMPDGGLKPIILFHESTKGLLANKTKFAKLLSLLGLNRLLARMEYSSR